MATYSPPTGQHFMDVQLTPANLKSGSIHKRFNWTVFPKYRTVTKKATTVTLTASDETPASGDDVTLTADVGMPLGYADACNGIVQFKNGSSNLGSPKGLNVRGRAHLTTDALTVGEHSITAAFASDTIYLNHTSDPLTVTVT